MLKLSTIHLALLLLLPALTSCSPSGELAATPPKPFPSGTSQATIGAPTAAATASAPAAPTLTELPSPTPGVAISRANVRGIRVVAAFDLEVKVPATGLAWSPDGRHLATGLGGCRVWTLGSTEPQFISQRAEQISWSGDGSELASSEGSYIAVWEEGSWSSTQTVSDASYPVLGLGMLTWDPQDHFLVAGGSIGPNGPYLLVWSPRNWELEQVIPLSSLASLTASPQGDLVAASTYDGRVRIWDTTDWREMPGIEPGCWNVNTLAFSPDGKTLATGDDCGKIKFWQMPPAISSRQVGPWLASPQGFPVASLAWSPDGTLIAAGLGNWQRNLVPVHPAAAIWDVVSGEMLNSIMGESPDDGSVAWSPDGTKLAVAGYVPNTIQILGVP